MAVRKIKSFTGTAIITVQQFLLFQPVGQDERNAQYGPYTPGFIRVPHCLEYRAQWDLSGEEYGRRAADAIEEVILAEGADTVGGLCLEPVTAGGGVITPPPGYWERVAEICQKYEILLHIDEVVCGVGTLENGLDTKTLA